MVENLDYIVLIWIFRPFLFWILTVPYKAEHSPCVLEDECPVAQLQASTAIAMKVSCDMFHPGFME